MANISVAVSAYPSNKDITVLKVKGFVDTNTAPEFEKVFQSVLAQNKFNLIIDLKEVTYISSAGWGIFIGELKRIRNQKGNLILTSMSPEVTDAFELLEFDTILKSFPDVDQAVQKGFGKTKAGKATSMAPEPSQPVSMAAPVEKAGKAEGLNLSFVESQSPKKDHWLVRILIPWKWF